MITFFAKAGVIAAAVAGVIAIVGSTVAGVAYAIKRVASRDKAGRSNETID